MSHSSLSWEEDVFDIVVHKNVRLPEVIVSDILDSDHLPIVFLLLDHVRNRNLSDLVDKFTIWERYSILSSELISSGIQINSEEEANKACRDFNASIASAYRLSTRRITLLDLNKYLPGLESPQEHN
jgi:hypothetical protein